MNNIYIGFIAVIIVLGTSCNNSTNNDTKSENKDTLVESKNTADSTITTISDRIADTLKSTTHKKSLEFKCFGNEPFWNLTISDTIIYFYEFALEKTWKYENKNYLRQNNKHMFISNNKDGKIGIEITEENCEDDMSGEPFEYSVLIQKGDNSFSGCCKCINK